MNRIAVLAVAGFAVLAAGGVFAAEAIATPDCSGPAMAGLKPGTGAIKIRLTLASKDVDAPLRTCMFDRTGNKLFDQTLDATAPVGQYWDFDLAAPVDHWVVDRAWPESMDMNDLDQYTEARCDGNRAEFIYEDHPGRGGLVSIDCPGPQAHYIPERRPAQQQLQYAGVLPSNDDVIVGGGGAFVLTTGLGGLLVLAIKFRTPLHWAFVGLFTRILAPKVLDQSVRSQIHQLVTQEPGIRPAEIAQRLEIAAGQTTHHLRVLVRAQALSLVRQGIALHYFVRGAYAPTRMQQLAALRSDSVAKLHRALKQHPGAPLTTLANLGGLSKPRASRLARRLERLGLARTERHGKSLRLYPLT